MKTLAKITLILGTLLSFILTIYMLMISQWIMFVVMIIITGILVKNVVQMINGEFEERDY